MRKLLWGLNSLLLSGLVVLLYVPFKDLAGAGKGHGFLNELVQGRAPAIILFFGLSIFIAGIWLMGTARHVGKKQEWAALFNSLSGSPGRSWARGLIALDVGLTAFGLLAAYGESSMLSEYQDAQSALSDDVFLLLAAAWILMFLVSRIGILFLWAPAREIYLTSILLMLLPLPLLGTSIDGPLTYLYDSVAHVLSGFILCFIYLTPAREVFRRTGDKRMQGDSPPP